jgi:hypothetical protein
MGINSSKGNEEVTVCIGRSLAPVWLNENDGSFLSCEGYS